jgi:hypothetical protein
MRKLLVTFSLILALFGSSVIVNAAELDSVTVAISSSVDGEIINSLPQTQNVGDTLSFNASTLDGVNQFAFWVINGFVRTDLDANLSVRVQSSMSVLGLFHTAGKHAVLFVDSNGKLIDQVSVLDNATADAPIVEGYSKPGGLVVDSVNPWKSLEGETSLENINSSRVYVLQYTQATGDLSILINGESINAVKNQVVVAVAANSSTFTHWADEEGNVLSYNPTFAFTALEDTMLFAETSEVTKTSFITMKDLTGIRTGYESYMGRFELHNDDIVIEYGFIYSDTTEDITLDTTGVVIAKSNVANPATNEFLMSFVSEHHVTTRAYAIVDNGTEIVTIYSDLVVKNPVEVEPVLLNSFNFSDGGDNGNSAYATKDLTTNVSYASDDPSGKSGTTVWKASYANLSMTTATRLGGKLVSTEIFDNSAAAFMATGFKYNEVLTKVEIIGATEFGTQGKLTKIFIQSSTDGTTWTTVSSTTTKTGTLSFENLNIQPGSYIRVLIALTASSKNSGLAFTGIKVYGYPI